MSHTWDAEEYSSSSGAQQKWARELLPKLRLSGSEHVLDIGCGDGKVTAEIAEHLPDGSILGIDSSAEMIAFARENFPPACFPNVGFEQCDARTLAFDAEFDVVFSNACLHWVVDHAPVLRGIAKSLRPGGRILLQMGGRGNAAAILGVLDTMLPDREWRRYFDAFTFPYGFYTAEEYRAWLTEAGLEPVRAERIPKDMVQQGRSGLAGWVRTTWLPYTARVPADLRETFIAQVVERYVAEHPPDAEGGIHVRMVRLEVEARRPAPSLSFAANGVMEGEAPAEPPPGAPVPADDGAPRGGQ